MNPYKKGDIIKIKKDAIEILIKEGCDIAVRANDGQQNKIHKIYSVEKTGVIITISNNKKYGWFIKCIESYDIQRSEMMELENTL